MLRESDRRDVQIGDELPPFARAIGESETIQTTFRNAEVLISAEPVILGYDHEMSRKQPNLEGTPESARITTVECER